MIKIAVLAHALKSVGVVWRAISRYLSETYQELVSSLSSLRGCISWAPKLGEQNHGLSHSRVSASSMRSKSPSCRCIPSQVCFDNTSSSSHGLACHTKVKDQASISYLCHTSSSVSLSKLFKRSMLLNSISCSRHPLTVLYASAY